MPRNPNYIIIGTMKSGTTALHDFICKHPEVEKPTKKEIHYFSLFPNLGNDWYQSHFHGDSNKIIGEASPTYFDAAYTPSIPRLIKSLCPNIKLILIVRDPIERAVSHFFHLKNVNKIKEIVDIDINHFFGKPYKEMITKTSILSFFLNQTIDFSLYKRKYQIYLSIFDKEQILVLDSSDLKNNARITMNRVYEHIGVDSYYDGEFEQIKYSSGKNSNSSLSLEIKKRLHDIFHDDFQEFWRLVKKH